MAIEIVDLPIENGGSFHSFSYVYQRVIDAIAIGSMVLLYIVTWIPSIYPLYVSIYTSTMDPMG